MLEARPSQPRQGYAAEVSGRCALMRDRMTWVLAQLEADQALAGIPSRDGAPPPEADGALAVAAAEQAAAQTALARQEASELRASLALSQRRCDELEHTARLARIQLDDARGAAAHSERERAAADRERQSASVGRDGWAIEREALRAVVQAREDERDELSELLAASREREAARVRDTRAEAQAEAAAELAEARRALAEAQRALTAAQHAAESAPSSDSASPLAERAEAAHALAEARSERERADAAAARADAAAAREDAATARAELSAVLARFQASDARAATALLAELAEFRADAAAARADADAARAALDGSRGVAADARAEADVARVELARAKRELEAARAKPAAPPPAELATLRDEFLTTRAERDRLASDLATSRRAEAAARDSAGGLQQARTRMASLEAELSAAQDEARVAAREAARLALELAAVVRQLGEADAARPTAGAAGGAGADASRREADEAVATAEAAAAAARAERDGARAQLAAEQAAATELRGALEAAELRAAKLETRKQQKDLFAASNSQSRALSSRNSNLDDAAAAAADSQQLQPARGTDGGGAVSLGAAAQAAQMAQVAQAARDEQSAQAARRPMPSPSLPPAPQPAAQPAAPPTATPSAVAPLAAPTPLAAAAAAAPRTNPALARAAAARAPPLVPPPAADASAAQPPEPQNKVLVRAAAAADASAPPPLQPQNPALARAAAARAPAAPLALSEPPSTSQLSPSRSRAGALQRADSDRRFAAESAAVQLSSSGRAKRNSLDLAASAPSPRSPTRAGAPQAAAAAVPAAIRRFVVAHTHPGGAKPADGVNQDTFFTVELDARNAIYAVFDGHGGTHGRLAAVTAAREVEAHLTAHFESIRTDAVGLFEATFERAHLAIRAAILRADPQLRADALGVLFDPASGEAADGGTTATVCVVVDGTTLVHAQVGDSSAAIGGFSLDPTDGVIYDELMPDHTPDELAEFERVMADPRLAHGPRVAFVYDTPDAFDESGGESVLHIHARNATTGAYEWSAANQALADSKGVGFKNARGDRPTLVLTPAGGPYAQQTLGMTRSLGDFYLHACGVSWMPEVSTIDLTLVCESLRAPVLFLASDGFWDLWTYNEAFEHVVCAGSDAAREAQAMNYMRLNREKGADVFGLTADNMTAILVYLDPQPNGDEAPGVPQPVPTRRLSSDDEWI